MNTKVFLAGFVMAACTMFGGCQKGDNHAAASPPAAPASHQGTIVAVGDSLSAGFGLKETEAYPAQLERKLHQAGYQWRVVNAGISGETSSGTLSRIKWILKLKPDIVILEIGANDGMRGLAPEMVRKNIDQIVSTLQQQGVVVVLAGMQMLRNLGNAYTTEFVAIYPRIAKEHNVIFEPFFLKDVAGDPNLNQADGIHPTGKGYSIVTDNIYPYVVRAIEQETAKKP